MAAMTDLGDSARGGSAGGGLVPYMGLTVPDQKHCVQRLRPSRDTPHPCPRSPSVYLPPWGEFLYPWRTLPFEIKGYRGLRGRAQFQHSVPMWWGSGEQLRPLSS